MSHLWPKNQGLQPPAWVGADEACSTGAAVVIGNPPWVLLNGYGLSTIVSPKEVILNDNNE